MSNEKSMYCGLRRKDLLSNHIANRNNGQYKRQQQHFHEERRGLGGLVGPRLRATVFEKVNLPHKEKKSL